MRLKKWSFVLVGIVIALLDFFVPFYGLKDVGNFFGSYLFWVLLALMVIVSGLVYINRTWGSNK